MIFINQNKQIQIIKNKLNWNHNYINAHIEKHLLSTVHLSCVIANYNRIADTI